MALPALHALKAANYQLILCGRPWAKDLFAGLEPLAFVPVGKSLGGALKTLKETCAEHGPLKALVFPNSFSSALLFRLAGLKTAGYRTDARRLLLKWSLEKTRNRHEVEHYYELARFALSHWQAGRTLPLSPGASLDLPLTERHHAEAQQALRDSGIGSPFVLLSPTAKGLHQGLLKRWSDYEPLARTLLSHGYQPAICPPPDEAAEAQQLVPSAQLIAPVSVGAFAALSKRAALCVCNDSGASHLAAAVQATQLTLFGVSHPEVTRPWSPNAVFLGGNQGWPALDAVIQASLKQLQASTAQDLNTRG